MTRFQTTLLLCTSLALSACSMVGKHYSEINPEDAIKQVNEHNGYYELKEVSQEKSKVVFRASGLQRPVIFEICMLKEEKISCETLEKITSGLRDILLPWIANMGGRTEYVLKEYSEKKTLSIKARGSWNEINAYSTSSGSCGPLFTKLDITPGKNYVVDFIWDRENDNCLIKKEDATNPDNPLKLN